MRRGWTVQFGTTDDHTRFAREQSRDSTPEERLSAVELLRRMHYVGADPSSRLQRVLVMSEVPWRALHDRRRSCARRSGMATLGKESVRVDIFSSVSGVSFTEAWRGRVTISIDGEELHFLGLDAMKKTKQAAGRTKNLLDLALLSELEGPADVKAGARGAENGTKRPAARRKTKPKKSRR